MLAPTAARPHETAWLWMAKIVTGVLIFAILGIHLIVNHMVVEGGLLTYNDVLRYYSNPLIPIMEAFFLIFVVSHALLGVRGIVLDMRPSDRLVRRLNIGLLAFGAVAIAYGLWLLIVLWMRAAAL
jgi:succinate dehydrogenase hydrophobic anchor subunit